LALFENLSVVIPCYNEEEILVDIVKKINSYENIEIIIVCARNNKTFELAKNLNLKNLKVIFNKNDNGKGHALWKGINLSERKYICNIDADGQFDYTDIRKMYKALLDKKELTSVHGSRFLDNSDRISYNGEKIRNFGNILMAFIASFLTKKKITDVSAGMKIWKKEFLIDNHPIHQQFFYDFELIVLMSFKKLNFIEVPIKYSSRKIGVSLMGGNTLSLGFRGIKYISWGFYTYILCLIKLYKYHPRKII
jgi:glycosyltransferase involved in cell wall biosynthesis